MIWMLLTYHLVTKKSPKTPFRRWPPVPWPPRPRLTLLVGGIGIFHGRFRVHQSISWRMDAWQRIKTWWVELMLTSIITIGIPLNKAGNFLGGVVLGGGRPLISMMLVGWVDRSATFPPCKRLELLWLKMIEHRLEPERISLLRRTIPLAHLEFFGFHVRFRGIDNQAWEGRGNQILSPFGLSKWYPHAPHFQCFQCTAGFFCNTSLSLCEVQAKIWGQFRSRISSIQEFPPNSAKYPMPAGQLHN